MGRGRYVFISYVREDEPLVARLARDLRSRGIEVWLDRDELQPGQRWREAIRKAIQEGWLFIACFSPAYYKRDKSFMNEELALAIEELRLRTAERIWFIPVKLSPTTIPRRPIGTGETLHDLQWVDLTENWSRGIEAILGTAYGRRPRHVSSRHIPVAAGSDVRTVTLAFALRNARLNVMLVDSLPHASEWLGHLRQICQEIAVRFGGFVDHFDNEKGVIHFVTSDAPAPIPEVSAALAAAVAIHGATDAHLQRLMNYLGHEKYSDYESVFRSKSAAAIDVGQAYWTVGPQNDVVVAGHSIIGLDAILYSTPNGTVSLTHFAYRLTRSKERTRFKEVPYAKDVLPGIHLTSWQAPHRLPLRGAIAQAVRDTLTVVYGRQEVTKSKRGRPKHRAG
ncbi:MAG: hypothetical protein DMF56_11920 [Acidobacteria bacterium]|nr:MAG: hypothetical protein DMF56_11920 [Acidobacteriota bacterium]